MDAIDPLSPLQNHVYKYLGVEPVIHAGGTKTTYGGSRMRDEVLIAIQEAARSFVDIVELNRAVGRFIADATGAEAGLVTSGAASGVVLSMAACMTGTDRALVRRLPDTTGMKDELVIQKIHRGKYSHMYTFPGARIVEVGDVNDCLPEEMVSAFTEQTAAVAFLFGPGISRTGLSLPEVVALAHTHGIPVIVDAAAALPPRDNLKRFITEGADLVQISGGKIIRGPQDTGLLFGRENLVAAALANQSPEHAVGRPHKVSKEDLVGLHRALEIYLQSDEAAEMEEYQRRLRPMAEALDDIPGLHVRMTREYGGLGVPTAVVEFHDDWTGPTVASISAALLDGRPRIYVPHDRQHRTLVVNPINLQPGEAEIVAGRLAEAVRG